VAFRCASSPLFLKGRELPDSYSVIPACFPAQNRCGDKPGGNPVSFFHFIAQRFWAGETNPRLLREAKRSRRTQASTLPDQNRFGDRLFEKGASDAREKSFSRGGAEKGANVPSFPRASGGNPVSFFHFIAQRFWAGETNPRPPSASTLPDQNLFGGRLFKGSELDSATSLRYAQNDGVLIGRKKRHWIPAKNTRE
jgi:hypothetical protein